MKWKCRRIQGILADRGPQALRSDATAQAHLESCNECFEVLESLSRLDASLAELSPHDAPDELVEELLGRAELRQSGPAPPRRRLIPSWKRPPRWLELAAAVALLGFFATWMIPQLMVRAPEPASFEDKDVDERTEGLKALGYVGVEVVPSADAPARQAGRRETRRPDQEKLEAGKKGDRVDASRLMEPARRREAEGSEEAQAQGEANFSTVAAPPPPLPPPPAPPPPPAVALRFPSAAAPKPSAPAGGVAELEESLEVTAEAYEIQKSTIATGSVVSTRDIPSARDPWVVLKDAPESGLHYDRINVEGNAAGGFAEDDEASYSDFEPDVEIPQTPLHRSRQAVAQFLAERQRIEGLRFQAPEGYWANTYVPGDPALRLLDSRARKLDPTPWQPFADAPLRLHDASRQPTQPFDPPVQAALAAYLHADWRSVAGPTRLLVQVGLQGTPRYSGRRPAMNVGVVLDLRGTASAETLAAMRALVSALAQAKDVGDQFRLFVAGRPGGQLLGPSEFRHGPVTVALQRLAEPPAAGPTLTLPAALAAAIDAVAATDDPTKPLGSSLVMLVTAQSLAPYADDLVARAHASAVAGVPVSAVGIATEPEELERLALAGQGHRRLLRTPAEADALVDRELSAVGRVIARALRLRIRLAPGVELVNVVGSRRLEEILADRVREAERSIDRRLERNLGIQADRGEDEEGIQIVVPSFYAGDAHVVLLDVVVPGPGAVADLTVRYKDLVQMGNGVARAHLNLARGEPARGPLERNVLGNFLAHRLEQALGRAGAWLGSGQRDEAVRELESIRLLLAGLRLEVAGFDKDRDLARDLGMVDEYLTLLAAGVGSGERDRQNLADSLRYAGRLKVLPRPASGGMP